MPRAEGSRRGVRGSVYRRSVATVRERHILERAVRVVVEEAASASGVVDELFRLEETVALALCERHAAALREEVVVLQTA